MDSPKKKKINWDDYRIRFHQYGEDYHYGSGDSWNYHSEAFPIVEGAEYVWLERRIRIDKINDEKEEISFTYFAKLSETKGFSGEIWLHYPQFTIESRSNSGGANDFFWSERSCLEICIVKKEECNE